MGDIARIKVDQGEVAAALKLHEQRQHSRYTGLGDKRSQAVTMGDIARIKVGQGEGSSSPKAP